jgi:hypothetical protein
MTSSDSGLEMGVVGLERGVGVRLEARVPLWELVVEDRERGLEWLLGPGEAEGAGVKYIEVLGPSQQEPMNKAIVCGTEVQIPREGYFCNSKFPYVS